MYPTLVTIVNHVLNDPQQSGMEFFFLYLVQARVIFLISHIVVASYVPRCNVFTVTFLILNSESAISR